MVEQIYEKEGTIRSNASELAAYHDHIDILEYIDLIEEEKREKEHRMYLENLLRNAIKGGHIDVVK